MNLLKKIFNFYINSSIHVALAVCAFSYITIIEFSLSISFSLLGFILFASITGYNFVKYAPLAKFHHKSLNPSLRSIQIFSLFCFFVMIFFAVKLSLNLLIYIGIFALLTFFYTIPILKNKNLRALLSLKIFVVALVWAGVTVLIPLLDIEFIIGYDQWISFFQRFFIVIVLTIPFEIRDLTYDSQGLGTFPQRMGIRTSKIIGILILMLILVLEFFKDVISHDHLISLYIFCLISGIFLLLTKKEQSKYFASFWVESIPIFWYVLLIYV